MYRFYKSLLEIYKARRGYTFPLYRTILELFIRSMVILGTEWRGLEFPDRAIGGWWWIWRFRWEILVGWYEYHTVQWCKHFIKPGMFVLDIGAHIGYYSWLFDRLVGTSGKVIAFEASPENFPVLIHNLQTQHTESVHPVQVAVSDFVGEVELHISPGHSNHSLIPGYTNGEGVISVPSTTVDDYLSTFCPSPVDFIKIDAEGAEIRILSGMLDTIRKSPTLTMVVEFNPRALAAGGWSLYDLTKKLCDLGFTAKEITEDGCLRNPYEFPSNETRNILCIPEGVEIKCK